MLECVMMYMYVACSLELLHYVNPSDGCNVLHRAAEHGRADNISVILMADEELANTQDYTGNTALHLACLGAHKQAVRTLLVSLWLTLRILTGHGCCLYAQGYIIISHNIYIVVH